MSGKGYSLRTNKVAFPLQFAHFLIQKNPQVWFPIDYAEDDGSVNFCRHVGVVVNGGDEMRLVHAADNFVLQFLTSRCDTVGAEEIGMSSLIQRAKNMSAASPWPSLLSFCVSIIFIRASLPDPISAGRMSGRSCATAEGR